MRHSRGQWSRALFWASLVTSMLLMGLWVMSYYWVPSYIHHSCEKPIVEVQRGCIVIWLGFAAQAEKPGFHLRHCDKETGIGPRRENLGFVLPNSQHWRGQALYVIPLWMPLGALMLLEIWIAGRIRRRRLPGHCVHCGYNLAGNVSGICPECGGEIENAE